MTNGVANSGSSTDTARIQLTFRIALVGIGAVVLVVVVAILAFHGKTNPGELITAVVGSVTGAIGTLAGLVAGHAAGAAGKEQAEQRAAANSQDAAAGRALAHALVSDAAGNGGGQLAGAQQFHGAVGPTPAEELARRHAKLAQGLFPGVAG